LITGLAMRLLTYFILVALLPGCGEVSYKRGGSQQDIDRAHQACRGSGDQLAACLAEQGWQKPKVDAMDPLFATIETRDNREEVISKPSPFIEITPEKKEKTATPAVVKPPQANATPPAQPKQAAAPTAQATTTGTTTEEKTEKSATHSTVNDGPDVAYAINSWWKMGAFPDKLKQDQVSCEKKLGPDYLPDYKTQTFKRAFVVCMHELGWMAIRNIK
jgi:type IV secretory pathway VirB10-like protein